MQVWADLSTKLRLQKTFNLFQDPFERADITSNTFWDWQINHIGQVYARWTKFQVRGDIKGVPAAFVPPSFSAATIMERCSTRSRIAQASRRESEVAARQSL